MGEYATIGWIVSLSETIQLFFSGYLYPQPLPEAASIRHNESIRLGW